MRFQLRSPELAGDFERLMAEDGDIVRGSLDTVSDWRQRSRRMGRSTTDLVITSSMCRRAMSRLICNRLSQHD